MTRFSIMHPVSAPPRGELLPQVMQEALEEARVADEAGFHAFLLPEHHSTPSGFLPSPLLFSAAVAARTTRIRVGTAVMVPALGHPIRVAEDTAVLDVLSGGRVILGVGAGAAASEARLFGIDPPTRWARMMECLEIIRRAWTETDVAYQGRFYAIEKCAVTPKPVQRPHPPIWFATWSPRGIQRAAMAADALILDPLRSVDAVAQAAAQYREAAAQAGKAPEVILSRQCWVSDSYEQALEECWRGLRQTLTLFWQSGQQVDEDDSWAPRVRAREDVRPENLAMDRFILGSPEQCVTALREIRRRTGIDHFLLAFRHGVHPPHDLIVKCLRRFAADVMPAFA